MVLGVTFSWLDIWTFSFELGIFGGWVVKDGVSEFDRGSNSEFALQQAGSLSFTHKVV